MKRSIYIFLLIILTLFTFIAFAEPPDYKQSDQRWADYPYTICDDPEQTIGNGGCGLAAMCDIIACWFDPDITPIDLAELSMHEFGTCSDDGATYTTFFVKMAEEYPFSAFKETHALNDAIQCLEEGGLVIVIFSGGRWEIPGETSTHACCLYSYSEDDDFRVHDPAWPEGIMSTIMGHVHYDDMAEHAKTFYCYWH